MLQKISVSNNAGSTLSNNPDKKCFHKNIMEELSFQHASLSTKSAYLE